MITLYSGEMFITPIPLHLSLNYCSHKCAFCFANLNNPTRTFDVKKMQSQLKNYHKQNNHVAKLMREQYPVLISNTVDPFATSNYQLTVPIIDQLTSLGIPVTLQTRGASTQKADEAMQYVMDNTGKSLYYISITTTSEDTRKRVEPGAPTIKHRLDLIDRIQKAGHNVVIGINPYVKEWIPDLPALVAQLYAKGIRNIWFGILHFNAKQITNMTAKEKAAIGDSLIYKKKAVYNAEHDEVGVTMDILKWTYPDLNLFMGINGKENHYFDIYHETYGNKTFPVFNDFYNHITEGKENGDIITFQDLINVFEKKLPAGNYDFSGLAYSIKRADYDKPEVREAINSLKNCHLSEYLKLLWNDKVFGFKPNKHTGFATLVELDGEDIVISLDKDNNERYVYDPVNDNGGEMYVFHNP